MSGTIIGFGIGIRFPDTNIVFGISQEDKNSYWLWENEDYMMWDDNSNIPTEIEDMDEINSLSL